MKRLWRAGTTDGEWMRQGRMPGGATVAKNVLILGACAVAAPPSLVLPKHVRMRVAQKMAYCRRSHHSLPGILDVEGQRLAVSASAPSIDYGTRLPKRVLMLSISVGVLRRLTFDWVPVPADCESFDGPDLPLRPGRRGDAIRSAGNSISRRGREWSLRMIATPPARNGRWP